MHGFRHGWVRVTPGSPLSGAPSLSSLSSPPLCSHMCSPGRAHLHIHTVSTSRVAHLCADTVKPTSIRPSESLEFGRKTAFFPSLESQPEPGLEPCRPNIPKPLPVAQWKETSDWPDLSQLPFLFFFGDGGQFHFTPSYFPNHDGSSRWPGPFPAWPLSCPLLPLSSQPSPTTFKKSSWQNYPNLLTLVRGAATCAAGHEWNGAASTLAVVTEEP